MTIPGMPEDLLAKASCHVSPAGQKSRYPKELVTSQRDTGWETGPQTKTGGAEGWQQLACWSFGWCKD